VRFLRLAFATMALIVLPYEPGYKGHRVAEERRKKTAEWLQQRERELDERSAEEPSPRSAAHGSPPVSSSTSSSN
jgi:hypothetical protein